MEYLRLKGLGVSPGIAIGEVFLTQKTGFSQVEEKIHPTQIENEIKRFHSAL